MALKLKEVLIASYEEIIVGPYNTTLIIDEHSTRRIICIISEDETKAIDINNGEVYQILKRTKSGKRIKPENELIEVNKLYALRLSDVNKENYTLLDEQRLNWKAMKTYLNYLNKEERVAKTR